MKKMGLIFLLFPFFIFSQVWVARYNGTPGENPDDEAHAIVLDDMENVYVTGWSPIDYGENYDYATIKYDRFGVEQWVARYNGPGDSTDRAKAIGLDDFGNVYVTGFSWGGTTKYDFATIKYNNQGETIWIARYDGPAHEDDQAYALAVSPQGEVYVTGFCTGTGSHWDYCTIKYNTQGETLWVARYNGTGNSNDAGLAIAIDSIGNCFVTGYSYGDNSYFDDCLTIKYNPQGETVWVARYNGTGNESDGAVAIKVNESGDVWITGYSRGVDTTYDYVTIRYDSNGQEAWVARYNGPDQKDDRANALVVDGNFNVYVTGSSTSSNLYSDFATIKYDSAGTEQWVNRYNGLDNNIDMGNAITLDPSGNVGVTGYSRSIASNADCVTIKYSPLGETCWVAVYNYQANMDDLGFAITTDDSGYFYVTGYSFGLGSFRDYLTIKYYPDGMIDMNEPEVLCRERVEPLIFPNPTRNFVQVATSYPVRVFTASGQIATILEPGHNIIRNLAQGIYFVEFNNRCVKKLIILNSN